MDLDKSDIAILSWLAEFNVPIEIREDSAPHDVKVNLIFYGMNRHEAPNSIFVRLFDLENYKLVKSVGGKKEITDAGRVELQRYQHKSQLLSFAEDLRVQELIKNVDDLDNRLKNFKPSNRIAIIALVVSILTLLTLVIFEVLKLNNK